jgi:hypothetical protein
MITMTCLMTPMPPVEAVAAPVVGIAEGAAEEAGEELAPNGPPGAGALGIAVVRILRDDQGAGEHRDAERSRVSGHVLVTSFDLNLGAGP